MAQDTSEREAEQVQDILLRSLRDKEFRPIDLLESLSAEGYSTADLKLALAQLLHEGKIELSSGRVLRAAA